MHALLICALLTSSQPYATCWHVNITAAKAHTLPGDACAAIINAWLEQSEAWLARNPRLAKAGLAEAEIACTPIERGPVRLPEGAVWGPPLEALGSLVIHRQK